MKIFTSTTYTWYELGAFKWAVFLIGVAVGAHWSSLFTPYTIHCFAIGLILSLYVGLVWWKQIK